MALIGDSELNASSFCTRCRELLWRPQDSRDLHTIHNISEADLMASVQDNCRICRTLWSTADKISMDWTFKTSGSIPRLLWKHKDFVTIEYEREQFQLRPLLTMDDSPIISPLANTTASDATWSMISKWFSNCTTNHTKCERTPSKLRHLPTRLIDIGDLGSHNVRLVITRQLPDSATTELQYFTLSHRWGTGSPVKLLNENLQQFLLSIPWTSFSHTFQDAMTVTKKFGFRYIWIGSLCIIQNNAEDWLKESATMSDVYEGGICNIAATAAGETGTDGLFAKRDGTTIAPFMLDIARKGSVDRYLCSRNAFRYDGYLKSLLSRRGWVFQERLLSPRTLHFNQQVFWECKEIECAESYPMGLNDGQFIRDPGSGLKYEFVLPQKSWLEDIRTSPQRRYEIWQELVHGYTCCELSEEKDKLVAISGLVKKLQPVMNDEYICGLWRSDLLNGLTWWVEYSSKANGSPSFRPKQYRAPSWSWASVEGRIRFPDITNPVYLTKVVNVHIASNTTDATTEVTDAWLRVEGFPKPFRDISSITARPGNKTGFFLDVKDDSFELETSLVLPILWHCPNDSDKPEFLGLVLKRTRNNSVVYRRVGLLSQRSSKTSFFVPGLECDFSRSDLGWDVKPTVITIV